MSWTSASDPPPRAATAMDLGDRDDDQLGSKELVGRIGESLLTLFRTLSSANSDISIYYYYHAAEHILRDPHAWTKLDEAYTMYEEQSNNCRRLWMRLRTSAEKGTPPINATDGTSSIPRFRLPERSPSPLEYQSDPGEGEPVGTVDKVTPADVDLVEVERDDQRPPALPVNAPPPPKPRRKLAPIPKGVKLSVETSRIPPPRNPFTFEIPKKLAIDERKSLNRTKRNPPDTPLSQNSFSSLQPISQQSGPSTTQTSVSVSPKMNSSSASEYWEPRRPIRHNDFQMVEGSLFNRLDCLGPPFHVNTKAITHDTIPATWSELSAIYGGKLGLTPKISSAKLKSHGFNHWMTPNTEYHPCVPARPGWPGLMLRLDNGDEEWRPDGGVEFRVVIRKEPRFIEYVGQYEMMRLDNISGDEWERQPAKVRKKWAHILGGEVACHWHDAVVRGALRKELGREPSAQESAKYAEKLRDYAALAKELGDDIDRAFCSGQEVIAVWGMKCVGYDYKFEKHLARSLKGPKPSSSGPSKKQKSVSNDNNDTVNEDEDERKRDGSEPHDSPPPKRQRVAKGRARHIKYDWSGANYHDDSKDEDYKPASS